MYGKYKHKYWSRSTVNKPSTVINTCSKYFTNPRDQEVDLRVAPADRNPCQLESRFTGSMQISAIGEWIHKSSFLVNKKAALKIAQNISAKKKKKKKNNYGS